MVETADAVLQLPKNDLATLKMEQKAAASWRSTAACVEIAGLRPVLDK